MTSPEPVVITALGVVSALGRGVQEFAAGLRRGDCGIRHFLSPFPRTGAFLPDFSAVDFLRTLPECPGEVQRIAQRVLRQAPESAQMTVAAATEAWLMAGLHLMPIWEERIGIIIGGNNISQRYLAAGWRRFEDTPDYLSPRHAFLSLDTALVGLVSEVLGIHGCGLTVGAASASGNVAVWNAKQLLRAGVADCIIVCCVSSELSSLEMHAFQLLGAAAPVSLESCPAALYRPFDATSQGFIPGEAAACIVLETASSARLRGARVWAAVTGASLSLDGSHLPHASTSGEVHAMYSALLESQLHPTEVDYVNAHGSGSIQGDRCECDALVEVFGEKQPWVNSTKSLTGHCLAAAGLVELVACTLQMSEGFLHPNRNLRQPIDHRIRFVGDQSVATPLKNVLSNSFGFGGFNSSIVLRQPGMEFGNVFVAGEKIQSASWN